MRRLGLLIAGVLAGCGGSGSSAGADGSWLTFSPSPVQMTVYQGETPVILVTATSTRTISEPLDVGVVIDDPALIASVDLAAASATEYVATLHVTPSTVGVHDGALQVRLCRDAAVTCASPYPGSPWSVPYHLDVRAGPSLPPAVSNGDFGAGLAGWDSFAMNGGSLALSVVSGALQASIAAPGTSPYDLQVKYVGGGVNLEQGSSYRLSFDAWASAPRTILSTVWENGRDLDGNGSAWYTYTLPLPTHSLTTTPATFTVDFTMPTTNREAGVAFFVGSSTAAVYLDNVSVTRLP
ncbi:MAG TPA: carbohydrate binding domain-containing protein [Anaeromyxobacter sp.]|nr:carbohydrate binding domain-containing protein [Anaeromyxobacter sp.]